MTTHRRRRVTVAVSLALGLALVQGCAEPSTSPAQEGAGPAADPGPTSAPVADAGETVQVDLAVRDFALRGTEKPCAGARPYGDLHPTEPFTVRDSEGVAVAGGELPQGRSIKATDLDFGTAQREPTFCVFSLVLPVLAPGEYELAAGEDRAIPFEVAHGSDPIPVNFPPTAPGGSDPFGQDTGTPTTKDS